MPWEGELTLAFRGRYSPKPPEGDETMTGNRWTLVESRVRGLASGVMVREAPSPSLAPRRLEGIRGALRGRGRRRRMAMAYVSRVPSRMLFHGRSRPVSGRPFSWGMRMRAHALLGAALTPCVNWCDGDQTRAAPGFRQTGRKASPCAREVRQLQGGWPPAPITGSSRIRFRRTASPRSWCLCGSVQYKVGQAE